MCEHPDGVPLDMAQMWHIFKREPCEPLLGLKE
jgi:hypothetical protein